MARLQQVAMIIAFRHGFFELNRRSTLTGQEALQAIEAGIPDDADDTLGLLSDGIKQAQKLQTVLGEFKIDACLCSPPLRTRETAKIAPAKQRLPRGTHDEPALVERNRGIFRYAPDEWARQQPSYRKGKESTWQWKPPGGESFEEIRGDIDIVLEKCNALAPGGTVALSTHAEKMGLLRAVLLDLDDYQLRQAVTANHRNIPALKRFNWVGNGQTDVYAFNDPYDDTVGLSTKPRYFRTIGTNKPAFDTGWLPVV